MKAKRKIAIAAASFGLSFVTLISGTYAWYVVAYQGQASIGGTTIHYDNMRIGMKYNSDAVLSGLNKQYDQESTRSILWNKESDNKANPNIDTEDLKKVYQSFGYGADGQIAPVSTGSYQTGEAFNLYHAVQREHPNPKEDRIYALKKNYISFTLAFQTPEAFTSIYLEETLTSFVGENVAIQKAMRIGFSSTTHSSIYAPMYLSSESYYTEVGGILDLDGDYVYDADVDNGIKKEYYYGEAQGEIVYLPVDDSDDTSLPTDIVSANEDPWNAKHGKTYNFPVYKAIGTAKTQEAKGLEYYVYHSTDDTKNHPVLITDSMGYGELTVTIWLEGWDRACTNLAENKSFIANLGFVAK